jgi:hypothetical protein
MKTRELLKLEALRLASGDEKSAIDDGSELAADAVIQRATEYFEFLTEGCDE